MTSLGTDDAPQADEYTGLLNEASNTDANTTSKGTFYELFLNKRHTPGMDSDNIFVRWPARGFNVTKVTVLSNYVNILLPFVPLGIIAGAGGWDPTTVFILNFFAIIPLAAVLSFATEEISTKLGETLGGLLKCYVRQCCRAHCMCGHDSAHNSSNRCHIG